MEEDNGIPDSGKESWLWNFGFLEHSNKMNEERIVIKVAETIPPCTHHPITMQTLSTPRIVLISLFSRCHTIGLSSANLYEFYL